MISACELCAKIAIENAMKDEAIRVAKMQTAKTFAEEVIAPILENLTEVPDHQFIGYMFRDYSNGTLYRGLSEWQNEVTTHGNPVKRRWFDRPIDCQIDGKLLDYEVLNQYLAEFGFQLSLTSGWVCTAEYSTSTRDNGSYMNSLYISMTCPLEDC